MEQRIDKTVIASLIAALLMIAIITVFVMVYR